MRHEIKWKSGTKWKSNAVKAYECLEAIRKKNAEGITPEAVVTEASKKRSPIHQDFEWDDSAAAHEYRLETARRMTRSLQCIRNEAPSVEARVYESVKVAPATKTTPPRRAYQTTEDILKDPDTREQLLAQAIRDITRLKEKYHGLSELAKVFQASEKFLEDYVA